MWLYHFTIRNKALIYSIYLIFLCLGILTLWRWGVNFSLNDDYLVFRPLLISFILVLVFIKLMKPIYYTAFVALQLLSVIVITMFCFELSGFHQSLEELVGASIYLIAGSTVIALFIFEQQRLLMSVVGKAVLYSTTFFILLLISKLFIPLGSLLSFILFVVIVGQVVAYLVSLILLPLLSQLMPEKEMNREQVRHEGKTNKEIDLIFILIFTLFFIASILYIDQMNAGYSLLFVWFFSLFLIAGIYNSFRKSMIIHILLFLFIPSLAFSSLIFNYMEQETLLVHVHSMNSDLLMGLVLAWGVGLLPLLTWVYTSHHNRKVYSLSILIYAVALFPLVVGMGDELGLKWVTFMMIVGYSIVNSVSPIYYPVIEAMIYSQKKRSDRPFKGVEISEDKIQINLTSHKIVSAEEREQSLVTEYGAWLRKREQRLEQEPKH